MIRLFIWANVACVAVYAFGLADSGSHEVLKIMASHGQWLMHAGMSLFNELKG